MKFDYQWDSGFDPVTIRLTGHPRNREWLQRMISKLTDGERLTVVDPRNQRTYKLGYNEIVVIEALDRQSRVQTITGRIYYVNGRLKAIVGLSNHGLVRINRSTILNLEHVVSFGTEKYARLIVEVDDGRQYVVSRHYAKQIREVLQNETK